jgi:hypothetical protein
MRALHKSVKALLCKLELSLQAVLVLAIRLKRRLRISQWHLESEISDCARLTFMEKGQLFCS